MVQIYNGKKRYEIGSFAEIWMDLESVILSKSERNTYCILMHVCM